MKIKIELDGFTFELREIQGGIQIFETTDGTEDHIGEAPSCDTAIVFLKNEMVPEILDRKKQLRLKRAQSVSSLLDEFKAFCDGSILDGSSDDIDDHFDFLEVALETFTELKESE